MLTAIFALFTGLLRGFTDHHRYQAISIQFMHISKTQTWTWVHFLKPNPIQSITSVIQPNPTQSTPVLGFIDPTQPNTWVNPIHVHVWHNMARKWRPYS
jgi:hypothetical protein